MHLAEGDPIGGFPLNHACGTAVDSNGNIYVSSAAGAKVEKFSSAGVHLTSIPNSQEPCGLAVDSKGDLYVSEKATGEVVKYEPPSYGERVVVDASGEAKGVSVDPFDDRLYVAKGDHVDVYNADGSIGVSEVQRVLAFEATGGTFKLTFAGQTTSSLAYNASHAEVQNALEALSTIGSGNVSVTEGSSVWEGKDHIVTFTGALARIQVEQISCESSLTPSGANCFTSTNTDGFSGHVGVGNLSGATGVAAYTYRIDNERSTRYMYVADAATNQVKVLSGSDIRALKFRKAIKGPREGENFGFGPAGAYIAVDPGNTDAGTKKCVSIGEQACTAGHFLVYDAAHSVVDEFDASGEFLDQFDAPGLVDAQPTALAIDRSGGPTDGTIYATGGSGAGAGLFAFGPLAIPSRSPLPDLSHIITAPRAVATDSFGNVYVAAEATIHVFGPDGKELTTFEDPNKASDLAVDSAGHVYVLDATGPPQQVTYYSPGVYPPVDGTTYTRHEPPIVALGGLQRIAVNPFNDHLFIAASGSDILEFGSIEEGSPQNANFAPFFSFFQMFGVSVYAKTGDVYTSANVPGGLIPVISPTGAELLTLISGAGSASGTVSNSASIDVDESNGHVVAFAPGANAQEYDAAGAPVAEFGPFASSVTTQYSVAVDSACAIHRNAAGELEPLTETTSPTCKEFDPSNGNVYVAFDATDNVAQPYDLTAFGPLTYGEAPSAATGIASELGSGDATLNGTVDPRGFELEDCHFEFLSDAQYVSNGKTFVGASTQPCAESPAEIGKGTGAVSVHAELSGLVTSARYRFRLVARNKYGESEGDVGLFGPPQVIAKSPLPVLYDEATLRAEVDPSGLATKYKFEYGVNEGYGQSTPLVELAPGDGPVAIEAALTGLSEGTLYHFRFVVENEAGTVELPDGTFLTQARRPAEACPNTEFRTGLSANLPDCRAYELVTPADMHGLEPNAIPPGSLGNIFNNWLVKPRGEGAGETLAYFAGTLPGFDGSGDNDGYRATRGGGDHPSAGWTTELVSPSFAQYGVEGAPGNHQEGVASDQRYSLWSVAFVETLGTLPGGHYLRTPVGFEQVGKGSLGTDPHAESRFISAGGAHVVFFSKAHLENGAAPEGTMAIYDRAAGQANAEVVSIGPNGSAFGAGESAQYVGASEDGTAVVFKVGGVLYLHRQGQTFEVAAAPNTFGGISEDGKRVFYIDTTFGEVDPPPASLMVCDSDAGSCAGPEATHAPSEIAQNSILAGVSPDGSHAFFSSKDALTGAEENEAGQIAEPGERNLYFWDGSGPRFIAVLDSQDFVSFGNQALEDMFAWTSAVGAGSRVGRDNAPVRSTPDGDVFVFQSHAQLTDYDNEGKGEIYRFESGAVPGGRLNCISCDLSDAPASGDALLQIFSPPGNTQPTTLISNVTDDGEEVFFQSPDQLLPEDANDAIDVYEWRAQGAGGCKLSGGCLALISSGQGEEGSYLYGMSADGRDVFFETPEKLVGADVAGSVSIYDARVGGGIPDPPSAEPCHGDACQGQGTSPPSLLSPASNAAVPNGNVRPGRTSCPRGKQKVKRNGKSRCVKQRGKAKGRDSHHKRRSHR